MEAKINGTGTKTMGDRLLAAALQKENVVERTKWLIAAAGAYLRAGFFLNCSAVLQDAEKSAGDVRDKASQVVLREAIRDLNDQRGREFKNYQNGGDVGLPVSQK